MARQADNMRIALAHDWLVGMRGGEWVLDRLARLYGPTTLYTLVDDGQFLTEAIAACDVVTSPLQRLPGAAGKWRRAYLPLMPWAVERLPVESCDLLISTSSAVMKSIRPPEGAKHLCYCHSPARYVWEQAGDYARGSGGMIRSLGLRLIGNRFRGWDRRTADRVDRFIANSKHTATRIERCYGREARVVYPPARTKRFTVDSSVEREDWYLVVAALEPYKRTELAIEAAREKGRALKVVGSGSQLKSLRARHRPVAGAEIEFLGRVDEDELLALYRRARALIFPQVEDFGIVAVEAQATGCPVIAFADGGAVESVTEETGVFFEQPSVASLVAALELYERRAADGEVDAEACRANAERFAEAVFDEAIGREVDALMSGAGTSG